MTGSGTLFFSGVPAFAAWQIADGALVRWAYSDTSLRSYWLSDFSLEKARRGPVFFFFAQRDSLIEVDSGPSRYKIVAITQALSEHFEVARDALLLGREGNPGDQELHYWLAWVSLALGDTTTMRSELLASGCEPRPGPNPELSAARQRLEAGDTLAAQEHLGRGLRRHALDPGIHATSGDLLLAVMPQSNQGAIEALAARLLSPRDPAAWRRWAMAQVRTRHFQEAHASLGRYFELAGPAGAGDLEARRLFETLGRALPGGRLAEQFLRSRPAP